MAISKAEQLSGPMQKFTKKEAKAYNDAESKEARLESQPRDGESYLLLTQNGIRMVTFTTYGAETVTKKRTRQNRGNKS